MSQIDNFWETSEEKLSREKEKQIALALGFQPKKNDPDLFWKRVEKDVVEFIDFRRSDKGARYGLDHGRRINGEEIEKDERFRELVKFKELRDNPDKAERSLAAIQKEKKEIIERKAGIIDFKVRGSYYEVAGKAEPDAWTVMQWFNKAGGSIEIVKAEQTNNYARVIVRAILNGRHVEDTIWHDFIVVRDIILFDLMDEQEEKGEKLVDGFDKDGMPILSGEGKKRFLKRYLRFKNFSLRDATSKCSRRAILKIMNYEWREEEEIGAEKKEVEMVNERSKENEGTAK